MNKRINSSSKSHRIAINPKLKLWWGLQLILVLALCSTVKTTVSYSYSLNPSKRFVRLPIHKIERIKHLSFSTIDTIGYTGPPILCPGGTLLLNAENAPSNASFKWFKNGNLTPIATTPTYTVNTPGTYSVITKFNGVTVNYPSLLIKQDSVSTAQFKDTTTSDCSSSAVNFINLSKGDDLTYNWNFGDPNANKNLRTSNLANPSHVFIGSPGDSTQTFTVSLTITTKGGCTNTITHTITRLQSPDTKLGGTGSLIFNGNNYFAQCTNTPSTFYFSNLSSTSTTNTSYSIVWGDGSGTTTMSNFTTIAHTYRVGNFKIFYTINGKNGCSITKKYYIFVGKSPAAGFENSPVFTCINTPLVIQTSNIDNNSAGTIYSVNFSDGTTNFYTSVPDTIMHTFFSNSVNKTSQKQNISFVNSFSATLIASNPCGADTAILAPIYVSDAPIASFDISSNSTCAGGSIACTNSNSGSVYIDSTGNPHAQKFIWAISPNSGYILDGASSLGQDYGKSTPSLWLNGSQNFNLKFVAPGNYKIKLVTGNDFCGLDSTIKSICVNPLPIALFSISDSSNCAPFSVNTINQSNTPLCGLNLYKWTVNYSNNGCGNYLGNFSYKSGDSNSFSPQFNFIDPGVYTINLVNANDQCSSAVFSKQVIVKANPVIAISSPNKGLTNQKLQPAGLLKDCNTSISPTFLWLFPGAEPSSSTAFEPDSIVYKHAGTYNISFGLTNECGTTTVNQSISILDNISLLNAFIPNCFTPNGDGINDTWNINGVDANHLLLMQIFNRYGELISQIKGNPVIWDGKYKGEKLPAGVYFYILSVYNDNIHTEKRSGSVTIIY
jgi:gliding motility-associated-like protein